MRLTFGDVLSEMKSTREAQESHFKSEAPSLYANAYYRDFLSSSRHSDTFSHVVKHLSRI